ncbi:MAG: ABC transporter substrate-binding protein [Rhizobiaceae bacterium]
MTLKINRRRLIKVSAAATLTTALLPNIALGADPINVGSLTPNTGGGGPFGPKITAAHKMIVELVNKSGGIDGREVKLTQENSETNPETAIRAARKLVDINKVSAILGTWNSSVTLGIMPLCQEANVIQMCTSSSSSIPGKDKKNLVYNFMILSPTWGKPFGDFAKKQGAKTFAVMGLNTDFTKSTVDTFEASALGNGLERVQDAFYYNSGQASYRAEVSKLIAKNPDLVYIPGFVTDFTAVYKELFRQGYEGKVLAISIATGAKFVKAVGEAADGVLHGLPIPNLGSKAYQHYLSLVGLEDNGGVQHPFGTAGYDQITTLLLAIAKAKSSDGLKIAEAIHQVSNGAGKSVYKIEDGLAALAAGEEINFDGASSTVEYETPTGVLSSRDFGFWKIEGGKNKLLSSVKS